MSFDLLVGKKAKKDYFDTSNWEVFLQKGNLLTRETVDKLDILGLAEVEAKLYELEINDYPIRRWIGLGKYGSNVAITLLKPGSGEKRILGNELAVQLELYAVEAKEHLNKLLRMDEVCEILDQMEMIIDVPEDRSGNKKDTSRQSFAITYSIADALCKCDRKLKIPLRRAGFGVRRPTRNESIETRIDNLEVNLD